MSRGGGTHWQGPLLGASGVFEDLPTQAQNQQYGWAFPDPYFNAPLNIYWTATNLTAGTTSLTIASGRRVVSLSHNVADQGPSIRMTGTNWTDGTMTPITSYVPAGSGQNTVVAAMEARLWPSVIDVANPSNFFVGFMNGGAIHPLTAAGVLNAAGAMVDACGFRWTGSQTPVCALTDNDTNRTLPNLPTLTPWAVDTPRRYGVRVIQTPGDIQTVEYFLNGILVYRTRPGATQTGAFSTNAMGPVIGLVTEGAGGVTVLVASVNAGTKEYDLEG